NRGALNIGQPAQTKHDYRYDLAEEYLAVCYTLWEGSWEDGAVVRARESGIFTHTEKVHPIRPSGKHFNVPGIHLSEP
ncbi:5,10-methylene tetrahydromethanopterin reductase, partial [Rhizobium johnstonii]